VTSEGRSEGDIRIRDGVVVEIGRNLAGSGGAREIDAAGLLVMPGGVDPHVHIDRAEDFTSGSSAALAGGITTISSLAFPQAGESLADALARHGELVRTQAIADVMLHPGINDPEAQRAQMASLPELGQTSVKVFMSRPQFDQNSRAYLAAMEAAGKAGVLTMMHCEDDAIVARTIARLMEEGHGSLGYFSDSRPVLAEVIATRRAVAMAEATGAPVYIVHLSAEGALRVAEEARSRGLPVFVEALGIYLHLTRERLEGADRGLYVHQPPLREKKDQDALWKGIAAGTVHVVATDHVPYTKTQKLDSSQTVADLRPGIPNLQEIRPMLYSEGVRKGRITEQQFVAVTSTNPAKLFGLYPRKGTLAVGSDADIVLWDENERRTIRDEDMLSRTGFSIHAGQEAIGWPRMTIRRGEIVYENGKITGQPGSGKLLRRGRWQAP
jgi:dihydropyrimidinase